MSMEQRHILSATSASHLAENIKVPILLILFELCILLLLINPGVFLSSDSIYLIPKLWWIYIVLAPTAGLLFWRAQATMDWWMVLPVLLFSGWLLVTSLWLRPLIPLWMGPEDRADGILMHLIYCLIALSGAAWMSSAPLGTVLNRVGQFLSICGGVLSLVAILQQLQLLGVPGLNATEGMSATVAGGTLGNRGYMGGALALLLPLTIWHIYRSKHKLSWILVFLVSWGLVASMSRGAWLAGFLGTGLLLFRIRPPARIWLSLSLGIICAVVGNFCFGGRQFSHAEEIFNNSGRTILYKSALIGIGQKPLTGWGVPGLWKVMSTFSTEMLLEEGYRKEYTSVVRLRGDSLASPRFIISETDGKKVLFEIPINKVHNEYFDYALTYGLPATALFIWLLGLSFTRSWSDAPVISAAIAAYGTYLLTWPEVVRFAPLAWFLIGLGLTCVSKRADQAAASSTIES
ncbi:O-antigen ligase family protein [Deinococcus sp. HMF7604]|uniref:O-antigen ligase family protein n=1 Tax=Deinococcus betulae TaxID=2873312 RepID=UPI001CCECEE3|nr:O-antigen ligase family protein [Deinococcus betulae]MBZ9753429.1 O-antigen ligase family protein [Deinococcus betulae]